MSKPVKVRSAPGLVWKKRGHDIFEARWQARTDLVNRGFKPKSVKLWRGVGEPDVAEWDRIADICNDLQQEMIVWGRGGLPAGGVYDGTLGSLMQAYKTDPDSAYRRSIRYASRKHYDALMDLIRREHAKVSLANINGRLFLRWHQSWSAGGKIAVAHAKIGMLRTLFTFGSTMLEDEECARLSEVLSNMRFPMPKPRTERLTAEQANAIRAKAHEMGRPSIALAQAFQFECMFRQRDCIGEWVPLSEPGVSDVQSQGYKWLRGIRWEEISKDLILHHITSKRNKPITVNLRNAPMVMEELGKLNEIPSNGPIVVSEWDGLPWSAPEFRRWWRIVADACGVPKAVRNMDSRAGAISEATDAGAELEHVRHAATHSDISMTQRYSRNDVEKVAKVQQLRLEHRNKGATKGPKT